MNDLVIPCYAVDVTYRDKHAVLYMGYKVRWCYCLSTVSERSHGLGLTNS